MTTQKRGTHRRNIILQACLELLLEVGADNLTHRMIAERASVPLGSTTYYFSSLDELIEAALQMGTHDTNTALVELQQRLESASDIPSVLAVTLRSYLADREQLLHWGELYAVASHRPGLRPFVNLWRNGLVQTLSSYMSEESAQAVSIYMDGVQLHALVDEDMPPVEDLTRSIGLLIQ